MHFDEECSSQTWCISWYVFSVTNT
jgi:hypothetical protein